MIYVRLAFLLSLLNLLKEMLELADGAGGPAEALGRVPQVAHDESVLPTTFPGSWTPEVGGWRRPVVNSSEPEIVRIVSRI